VQRLYICRKRVEVVLWMFVHRTWIVGRSNWTYGMRRPWGMMSNCVTSSTSTWQLDITCVESCSSANTRWSCRTSESTCREPNWNRNNGIWLRPSNSLRTSRSVGWSVNDGTASAVTGHGCLLQLSFVLCRPGVSNSRPAGRMRPARRHLWPATHYLKF